MECAQPPLERIRLAAVTEGATQARGSSIDKAELFENRALLHRVLVEKQELLKKCKEQKWLLLEADTREVHASP